MRERLWILFGLVMGLSFAIQVSMPVDLSEWPETSYETAPRGHAALFELLTRFDSVHGRWLSGVDMPPIDETVWWIAASGVCDERRADLDEDARDAEDEAQDETKDDTHAIDALAAPFRYTVEPWIEAGGTAVVWLSHPPLESDRAQDGETSDGVETREAARRMPLFEPAVIGDRFAALESAPEIQEPNEGRDDEEDLEADPEEESDPETIREDWQESLAASRRALREGEPGECPGIAGHELPSRRLEGLEGGELPPDEEDSAASVFAVGRWVASRDEFDPAPMRKLPGATLAFFEPGEHDELGWQPLWVEGIDLAPFALERAIGLGRLIVVADARVLTNARLAVGDSAPFVFDWVADWGSPWIDEHRHGVVPESGPFRYLAASPAWAAFVGLFVLGGSIIWRGYAMPKRRVVEVDRDAPTLASFVNSLARLYARTGDPASAFERYRELSLDRIRRALGLAPGTPAETVLALMRRRAQSRRVLEERGVRDLLMQQTRVETAQELERAAGRLDELVRTLRDENRQGSGAGHRAER